MTTIDARQLLQIAAFIAFVFVISFAIGLGVRNGTFTGPSLAEQIDRDGFGQIVRDRHGD